MFGPLGGVVHAHVHAHTRATLSGMVVPSAGTFAVLYEANAPATSAVRKPPALFAEAIVLLMPFSNPTDAPASARAVGLELK